MVNLLFGNLQEARRRPQQFRYNKEPFELYTDDELHVRFRFGREFINLITNLLTDDLQRKTLRNHALQPVDQLLIASFLYFFPIPRKFPLGSWMHVLPLVPHLHDRSAFHWLNSRHISFEFSQTPSSVCIRLCKHGKRPIFLLWNIRQR